MAIKKDDDSKPSEDNKPTEEAKPSVKPTEPTPEPEPPKTTTRAKSIAKIKFNPFYQSVGIPHCPVCGDAKRTDLSGKTFCPQPKKPDDCWVKG